MHCYIQTGMHAGILSDPISACIDHTAVLKLHGIHAGIFNVSNKLFVALDVLYDMRQHVKLGEPPGNCVHSVLQTSCLGRGAVQLPIQELRYIEQKLYDGYFAFEAITARDWNAGICGICGIAPIFESGDGNCKNCTPLKKQQVRKIVL